LGGASPIGAVARAAAAIRAGFCRTALLIAADAQPSGRPPEQGAQRFEFLYPTGLHGPVGAFGLIMQRYRHLYGLNDAALAKLAITQRSHALLNPNACDKPRVPLRGSSKNWRRACSISRLSEAACSSAWRMQVMSRSTQGAVAAAVAITWPDHERRDVRHAV
jgi:hypothetical protein